MFYTIIGILWLNFYSYRLIVESLPRDLTSETKEGTIVLIILSAFLTFIYLVVTILVIKNSKKSWIRQIGLFFLNHLYIKPLEKIKQFILKFNVIKEILEKTGRCIEFSNKDINIFNLLIFYIPRVIVSSIFFIETVYIQKIIYTYKLFWLILIPLLVKGIIHLIQEVILNKKLKLEEIYFNVTCISETKYKLESKFDQFSHEKKDEWIILFNVLDTIESINKIFKSIVYKYFIALMLWSYFNGWLSCLIYNIIVFIFKYQ